MVQGNARLLMSLDDQTVLLLADRLVVPRNGQQPFHIRVVNYATQNDADRIHAGVRHLVQQLVELGPGHATMLPGALKTYGVTTAQSAHDAASSSSWNPELTLPKGISSSRRKRGWGSGA